LLNLAIEDAPIKGPLLTEIVPADDALSNLPSGNDVSAPATTEDDATSDSVLLLSQGLIADTSFPEGKLDRASSAGTISVRRGHSLGASSIATPRFGSRTLRMLGSARCSSGGSKG
jgi:hypothetical protein